MVISLDRASTIAAGVPIHGFAATRTVGSSASELSMNLPCFVPIRRRMLAIAGGFVVTTLVGTAIAQTTTDEVDPIAKKVSVYAKQPGKGPQIVFNESRWEFWWYFNREPLIGLREALFDQNAGQAAADEPFQKLSGDERVQLLVPRLVFALRDPNPAVRGQAALALAKSLEPSARPGLQKALDDKEFLVRLDAIAALGVWSSTFFLGRLEEMLLDEKLEMQARFVAGIGLGLIGGPQVTESFRQLLAPGSYRTLPSHVQAALAYSAGVARDPDNVPLVRALLEDKGVTDPQARAYLALALGKAGTDADLARTLLLLGDADAQVRRSAAIGLGVRFRKQAGTGSSSEAIKKLLQTARNDGDFMVRNFAYISLGWIGGSEATKFLREELAAEDTSQQTFLALALGLIGDRETVPTLIDLFQREGDQSAKGAFAIALGLHKDPRAAPALRKGFEAAGEPVLRGHIGLALGMIRDTDSIPMLAAAFEGANDVELIPNLAIGLGLLSARPAVSALIARVKKEPNEYVKQSLLYSVGLVGDRSALGPLSALIEAEKDVAYVRAYATTALGLLGEERPVRAIGALTVDSNYTVRHPFLDDLFAQL
jgi:HEAT repeat protein